MNLFADTWSYLSDSGNWTGDAGRLRMTRGGRSRELVPESEVDFFEEDAATTYRFVLENGTVTGIEITMPERILFRKVG